MLSVYVCPKTKEPLLEHDKGLSRADGLLYPYIEDTGIPNFLTAYEGGIATKQSLVMYDQPDSVRRYKNFLEWLFQTFNEDEAAFRARLVERLNLKKGGKVLITGCGLGDDIYEILDAVGPDGEVYATDLAGEMVMTAWRDMTSRHAPPTNVKFSVGDAIYLPFSNDFFDAAFHFGGLNLFDDIKLALSEMDRVVKAGGRVVIGDEGVAPWLKSTEYGRMAINNNALWAASAPIELLPRNAMDVHLSWVLGNCFYLMDFEVSDTGPFINADVPLKGPRGGTMRTRFFGQLEGVTAKTKTFVLEDAAKKGLAIHDWLEQLIEEKRLQSKS
jgi:SAM-dependent methyltransferase